MNDGPQFWIEHWTFEAGTGDMGARWQWIPLKQYAIRPRTLALARDMWNRRGEWEGVTPVPETSRMSLRLCYRAEGSLTSVEVARNPSATFAKHPA
jgi:hypothetical protein